MKISGKEVEKISGLSRLALTSAEAGLYATQLSKIIDYVELLNNLDTSSIEPTSHIMPLNNVMSEDRPAPSLPADEALRNAPDSERNFYRVPRIIE